MQRIYQLCDFRRMMRSRPTSFLRLIGIALILLMLAPRPGLAGEPGAESLSAAQLTVTKSVQPGTVMAGGIVTYVITVTNLSSETATGVTIADTLPSGFAYRTGTSVVTVNGVIVSTNNPTISGRVLTWKTFRLPSGRSDSFYGIHTFLQRRTDDSAYIDYQLNRSVELMGSGAYVTQLFDWIDKSWSGPPGWMVDFVNKAYDRGLTPVVRLARGRGQYWYKPEPDADGSYTTWAQTVQRVVAGLPRRDGRVLYVQVWNEPNLHEEWDGQANATEYGRFLVAAYAAIRAIGDGRIVVLNGPLSPGATGALGIGYLDYLDAMLDVSGAINAFDVWASHPYPNNHPPQYNLHDGTAPSGSNATIDLYQQELQVLANHGRSGVKVLLTETGYALGQADFAYEGYSPIGEDNRADYIQRAFANYWSKWPEVIGVCPYELVDPDENAVWLPWDWLWDDGRTHLQYDAVKAMSKSYTPVSSVLQITFRATAAGSAGTYRNDVSASATNASTVSQTQIAPLTVYVPTPTRTLTPTRTPTPTVSPTATATATSTRTPTPTGTPTPAPTYTPIATNTPTPTGTETARPTSTEIPAATLTATNSATATSTELQTPTLTGTAVTTPSPTEMGSPTQSSTPAPSETPTPTETVTETPVPAASLTITRTPTRTATYTRTATPSQTATITRTPTRTATGTRTATPSRTATVTLTPTNTATGTRTATPSPTRTATPTPSPTTSCDLVVNGGFESDEAWNIPVPGRAAYSDAQAHGGQRSMRIGIVSGTNYYSYATVRQAITVPVTAQNPTLAFWYYPVSADITNDLQYVLLQDENSNSVWVMRARSNAQVWTRYEYVVPAAYTGKPVTVYFGVLNDGTGGITAMYLDDVSLTGCGSQPTPTRSATPTTSPTPIPVSPTATPSEQRTPMPGRVFLPLSLRSFSASEEQPKAVAVAPDLQMGGAALATAAAADQRNVHTLWTPTGSEAAPEPGQGIALDPAENQLYVAAGRVLWALDTDTGQVQAQVTLPVAPRGLAVDGATGRVYAALWQTDSLAVVEGIHHTLWKLVPGIPGASGVAVDDTRVYVTATRSDELIVLDAETCAIIQRVPVGDAPYAVVFDRARKRVFVGNAGEDTVSIVDSEAGAVLSTVKLGGLGHPQNLALDSIHGWVYATYALTPKYRGIAAIDASTGQIVSQLSGSEQESLFAAYGIAVDAITGRVYVTTAQELLVLSVDSMSPEKLEIIGRGPGLGPAYGFGLTLAPAGDRLFVVDGLNERLVVIER